MPNDPIPYGGGVNPFGKPQPTGLTYGDMYNNMTGYSGTPFYGAMPNSGFNFSTVQYPINTPNANLSSDGNTGLSNAPSQSQDGNSIGNLLGNSNPLGAALGAVQTIGGIVGMQQLNKQPFPEYSATSDLQKAKSRSGQLSNMGYTNAQRNVFLQDLGRIGNEDYINAINMSGGNLSRALGARRSAMRFNALNQFAQGDAAQRMSNIRYDDSMTDKLQRLQDMNTQVKLNRRMALEQAYGGAIKAGTENIVNSFDSGQAMKLIAGGMA